MCIPLFVQNECNENNNTKLWLLYLGVQYYSAIICAKFSLFIFKMLPSFKAEVKRRKTAVFLLTRISFLSLRWGKRVIDLNGKLSAVQCWKWFHILDVTLRIILFPINNFIKLFNHILVISVSAIVFCLLCHLNFMGSQKNSGRKVASPTPCPKQNQPWCQPSLLRVWYTPDLKFSKDVESTASRDNLLQCLTVLMGKVSLIILSLNHSSVCL